MVHKCCFGLRGKWTLCAIEHQYYNVASMASVSNQFSYEQLSWTWILTLWWNLVLEPNTTSLPTSSKLQFLLKLTNSLIYLANLRVGKKWIPEVLLIVLNLFNIIILCIKCWVFRLNFQGMVSTRQEGGLIWRGIGLPWSIPWTLMMER